MGFLTAAGAREADRAGNDGAKRCANRGTVDQRAHDQEGQVRAARPWLNRTRLGVDGPYAGRPGEDRSEEQHSGPHMTAAEDADPEQAQPTDAAQCRSRSAHE